MLIKQVADARSWTTIWMWFPQTAFFLYALKTPTNVNLNLCRVYLPLQHRLITIHHLSRSPSQANQPLLQLILRH